MKNHFFYLCLTLFSFTAEKSITAVNPAIQWETLSTRHFEVIYDAKHYLTARKYALRLEFNHKLLSTYFSDSPDKTIVVLNDNTDLANGYATRIPYPYIMLYPVLPSSQDSIAEYADWPQELTLHEYTHILNFEPAHGVMGPLRSLLGTIITPTMLLPRWWHEGLAVEMETRFSTHGRLRSIYQDASLRALATENAFNLYSIADINESELPSWPRGARPYLFGSLLMSEIQNEQGATINNDLLQRYARRLPYFLNGPLEETSGHNFADWFTQTLQKVDAKAKKQLETLRQTPPTQWTHLASEFLESTSPQVSPNGRFLAFVAKNQWGKSSVQIFDRREEGRPFDIKADLFSSYDNNGENKSPDAFPAGNIGRLSWFPDSSGFVFDQVKATDSYANFSDLYVYDLKTKKNMPLTSKLRLREPAIALDGQRIAAVQLNQSNTRLVSIDKEGKNLKVHYSAPDFHRLMSPLFSDSETLHFVERDSSGTNFLSTLNLSNDQLNRVNLERLSGVDSLSSAHNGIVFTAIENGVRNLYITTDRFMTFQRLTHTETAVFNGTTEEREGVIYASVMTSKGLQVASAPLNNLDYTNPPPTIEPIYQDRYRTLNVETPNDDLLENDFGSLLEEKQIYSSSNYLKPRYILPFAYMTASGYGTQISTATFDPLEKQSYAAQAGYDSFTHQANLGINYQNNMTTWPINFSSSIQRRDRSLLGSQYDSKQISLLATHDLRPWSEDSNIGFGLNARVTTYHGTTERFGPQIFYLFDNSSRSLYSPIPFAGLQLTTTATHFLKSEKSEALTQGLISGTYFHSQYLPKKHIIAIHLMAQEMSGKARLSDYSYNDGYYLNQELNSLRFVLRGYDLAYFYFKNARSATFEYHLPLGGSLGYGTLPLFLKRSHLNLYAETLAVDGWQLDYSTVDWLRTSKEHYFRSYGAEIKGDLTLGYYFPLTWLLGIYQRPDYSGPGKSMTFIGIQI